MIPPVIPAQAGIQSAPVPGSTSGWIPTFAGMTAGARLAR
jgi:hypothetical protein